MSAGLLAFLIALFASMVLTVPVRALALRVGMVDLPGPRKHQAVRNHVPLGQVDAAVGRRGRERIDEIAAGMLTSLFEDPGKELGECCARAVGRRVVD